MTYDLIIVTQSRGNLIQVTQNCIDSARIDGAELNIIVVETGNPYKYNVDKIVEYNGEFNYNRALNLGLKYIKNEIHILANNDLIFHPGWSKIGELMKLNGYHSASVIDKSHKFIKGDFIYEGYDVEQTLTGWCIFLDDYCLEQIGKLDESVSFWYSDNLYALQLKKAGIKHGLFANCEVDHVLSQTLRKQSRVKLKEYQIGQLQKFNQRKLYYA